MSTSYRIKSCQEPPVFPKSRTGMIAADTGEKVVLFVFPFTSFKLASIRCKTLSFSGDYMWRNCVQPSAGTQKRLLALGDSRQTSLEWFRFPTKMGQQGFSGAVRGKGRCICSSYWQGGTLMWKTRLSVDYAKDFLDQLFLFHFATLSWETNSI